MEPLVVLGLEEVKSQCARCGQKAVGSFGQFDGRKPCERRGQGGKETPLESHRAPDQPSNQKPSHRVEQGGTDHFDGGACVGMVPRQGVRGPIDHPVGGEVDQQAGKGER